GRGGGGRGGGGAGGGTGPRGGGGGGTGGAAGRAGGPPAGGPTPPSASRTPTVTAASATPSVAASSSTAPERKLTRSVAIVARRYSSLAASILVASASPRSNARSVGRPRTTSRKCVESRRSERHLRRVCSSV